MTTFGGFGVAWAILAVRNVAKPLRVWLAVIAASVLPFVTLGAFWPLRLAFLAGRPAMERLADAVAAGGTIDPPRWVGPIRLLGARFERTTGCVGLLTDTNPGGPSGFIRKAPRAGPWDCFRVIGGDVLHVDLGGGWCYHEED